MFVPIKPGKGGADLLRISNDGTKYSFVTGCKGYKWMEAETCKTLGKEGDIDFGYFDKLIDDAREAIKSYGDFDWFMSDRPYICPEYKDGKPVYPSEVPWEDRNDYIVNK